jgi:serine/threonine-protein kinase
VGPQSDVYGLGAVLYHILAGRPPFAGKKVNEVLAKVRRGNAQPPSEAAPGEDIPPELDAICLRNLAMDPNDRAPDAVAFSRELERFQDAERDKERDRALREGRVTRAREALARYDEARGVFAQHASARRRYEAEVQAEDPVARKVPLWEARDRERALLDEVEARLTEASRLCRMAMTGDEHATRGALAELLMRHARRAEAMRDEVGAAWCARLLARIDDDGLYGAWLHAGAALTCARRA